MVSVHLPVPSALNTGVGAEGPRALRGFGLSHPDTSTALPLGEAMQSGRPYRLRIQLFPGCACGWALDGERR